VALPRSNLPKFGYLAHHRPMSTRCTLKRSGRNRSRHFNL
jgi:hypothetical protein